MIDFDRIRAVKRDAQARLLKIPGVHAVAIGPKVVAGKSTADPSIIVYLVKKKSPEEISPEELLPPEIDGIKTDVIEQSLPTVGATLEGGLKISRPDAHWGTLGCIATSSDKSKVYAITCYHVVQPRHHQKQTLTVDATTAGNSVTYVFSGSVEPQTVIYVNFQPADLTQDQPGYGAFYTTMGTETLDQIAANVAQAVEDMAVNGIDTSLPGGAVLGIDFLDGYKSECLITGKTTSSPSDLLAKIEGTTITFSGNVSGEFYGVFTNVNPGGVEPTYGAFAALNKGDDMEDVANAVAAAVDSMHITGIDVSSSGARVTVETPMEIEVVISPDTRMGQPQLCSICSRCCGPSIGSVDEARFDVDTALIELEPGITYFADQLNFGPVKDYYVVQDTDIHPGPYLVKKYGARTGKTHGKISALDRVGYRSADGPLHRQESQGSSCAALLAAEPYSTQQVADSPNSLLLFPRSTLSSSRTLFRRFRFLPKHASKYLVHILQLAGKVEGVFDLLARDAAGDLFIRQDELVEVQTFLPGTHGVRLHHPISVLTGNAMFDQVE
jgi:hypothetical protein